MRILLFVIFMLLPFHSVAEDIKVIEVEGTTFLSENTTPALAKATALNNARRRALEQAAGVLVHGSTVIYNSELISDLVYTATKGIIVKEDILFNKCLTKNEQIFCKAKIRAYVKPLNLERRGNFRILKASVQRPDAETSMKSPVFQHNDEIQIRVLVNRDAFINIFSVDQNGNIAALFPNKYLEEKTVTAKKEFFFPDNKQRAHGLKLRVTTPNGLHRAVETVLIVATKKKVIFLSDKRPENPTITDLMRELAELEPSVWTEKTIGYEVRE